MEHPLNNPVWNALISGNATLARGTANAKFFDAEVSPFAAVVHPSAGNWMELDKLLPPGRRIFLWADQLLNIPAPWKLIRCIPGFQMVYEGAHVNKPERAGIVPLTTDHIPGMLALTKLTQPGPFGTRTIEFGNYEGIFDDEKLVAMTGRRFHCWDYMEISAVCTHPAYLGKGYAKQLLLSQLHQIRNEGAKPYLHVKSDNDRAVAVYQSLGFVVRMPVYFYILQTPGQERSYE